MSASHDEKKQTNVLAECLFRRIVIPPEEAVEGLFDRRGRKSDLDRATLIKALVYHEMQAHTGGKLEEHVEELCQMKFAGSSLSQRRALMPMRFMDMVCEQSLGVLADPQREPGCFYRGYRLVGIDGSKFDLPNTNDHGERLKKHGNQYGASSAYSRLELSTLIEIGCHNPIAVCLAGEDQEVEYNLSGELYRKVPEGSLLLADQLYGKVQNLHRMLEAFEGKDAHFLVPLYNRVKYKVVEALEDGSAIVRVKLRKNTGANPNQTLKELYLRLVKATVGRSDGSVVEVALITDLIDPQRFPASELVVQYARRWEHEIFYHELKPQINGGDLLRSRTVETCYQEVIAMVLACHVLAEQKLEAARENGIDPLRISFAKVKRIVEGFWMTINLCGEVLDDEQVQAMITVMRQQIQKQVKPDKRNRSCPRVNHHHKSRRRPTRKAAKTIPLHSTTIIHRIEQ